MPALWYFLALGGIVLGFLALRRIDVLEKELRSHGFVTDMLRRELAKIRADLAARAAPSGSPVTPPATPDAPPAPSAPPASPDPTTTPPASTPATDLASLKAAVAARRAAEAAEQLAAAPAAHAVSAAPLAAADVSETPPASPAEPTSQTSRTSPTATTASDPTDATVAPVPRRTDRRTPDESIDLERFLGKRLLTWVGVGIIFISLAFFVKFAYDQAWLGQVFGPRVRVAGVIAAGLGMLLVGLHLRARGLGPIGFGLIGGGQAALYLAVFAASSPAVHLVPTALIGPQLAFVAMAAVTALGVALALKLDAMVVAVIALIGGFATPVLLSTGSNAREAFFTYLLVLDLGVMISALVRRWRALDALAFAGTVVMFMGWYAAWYHTYASPDVATLAWMTAFFLVFLILPFIGHWRDRTSVTVERFGMAVANLAWYLGYSCAVLGDHRHALGWICLALAAIYLGIGLAFHRRVGGDPRTLHAVTVIGTMLVTLSLAFHLPVDGLVVAWAAEAAVLVQLGYRFAYEPARWLALAVLALVLARIGWVHVPRPYPPFTPILNRDFLLLALGPLALGAVAGVHLVNRARWLAFDIVAARACGNAAGVLLLVVLSYEWWTWLGGQPLDEPSLARARAVVSALIWLSGGLAFAGVAARRRFTSAAGVGIACAAVSLLAVVVSYAFGHVPDFGLNTRFAVALAAAAALCAQAAWVWRVPWFGAPKDAGGVVLFAAPLAVLAVVSLEIWSWGDPRPDAERVIALGMACAWLVGGWVVLAAAKRLRHAPYLMLGLATLGLGCAAALCAYGATWPAPMMLVNPRSFVALGAIAIVLAARRLVPEYLSSTLPDQPRLPTALSIAAAALAWFYVTFEPSSWLVTNITDPATGPRAARFAITIAWVVYAIAALGFGFHRRIRTVRYAALILFGATAVKLLLIDMAEAQQLLRILSFLATGVALVGASYLYHVAEKRLGGEGKETAETSEG